MPEVAIKTVAIIITAIEGAALILLCVGTAIGQFVVSSNKASCQTLWGFKTDCTELKYTWRGLDAFGCAERRDSMAAGAAFAIITIACVFIAFLWGILLIVGVVRGLLCPAIVMLCGAVFGLLPWILVVVVYSRIMCECEGCSFPGRYKNMYDLGAGFVLLVVGYACHLAVTIYVCVVHFG